MSKKQIADKIKMNDDGSMEVTITFDPFEHGHELGSPRNYDPKKYKAMVENPKTQMHIKNGYAIGGYTHDIRNSKGLLKNLDDNGNPIIPALKTLSMEWIPTGNGYGLVKHTQRIANNKIGKEIQELIKAGIGGFSSAHNLTTGDFFGFDYVALPNFTTNRVIVDNTCKNGMCGLNYDNVKNELEDELYSKIEYYLDSLGYEYNKDDIDRLVFLEKQREDYKNNLLLLDKIKEAKKELEAQHKIKNEFYDFINNDFNPLKEKYQKVIAQLDNLGYEITDDLEIIPTDNVLNGLFKQKNIDEENKIDMDKIQIFKLKKGK